LVTQRQAIPQQTAVLQRQRTGELDGTLRRAQRPQPEPAPLAGLEEHRIDPRGLENFAEPAYALLGERRRLVVGRPQGAPEAPAALRLAGGIEIVPQLADLRALQSPLVGVLPVVVDPQLAPSEGGERHAMLQARELARARAAGIRGLVDIAHQTRHEARLAEGRDGQEDERQSASPQAGGEHEKEYHRAL